MTQSTVILLLLAYILAREVFFLYTTHKFVNKLMSHSFYDYQQSSNLSKAVEKPKPPKVVDDPVEDLADLQGFGTL